MTRNKLVTVLIHLFCVCILIGCKTQILSADFVNVTHERTFYTCSSDSICTPGGAYDAPPMHIHFNTIKLTKRTKELKVKGLIRESSDSLPMPDVRIVLGEKKGKNIYVKRVIGMTDRNGEFQIVVTADTNYFLFFLYLPYRTEFYNIGKLD